jgi:hypothetical protein
MIFTLSRFVLSPPFCTLSLLRTHARTHTLPPGLFPPLRSLPPPFSLAHHVLVQIGEVR